MASSSPSDDYYSEASSQAFSSPGEHQNVGNYLQPASMLPFNLPSTDLSFYSNNTSQPPQQQQYDYSAFVTAQQASVFSYNPMPVQDGKNRSLRIYRTARRRVQDLNTKIANFNVDVNRWYSRLEFFRAQFHRMNTIMMSGLYATLQRNIAETLEADLTMPLPPISLHRVDKGIQIAAAENNALSTLHDRDINKPILFEGKYYNPTDDDELFALLVNSYRPNAKTDDDTAEQEDGRGGATDGLKVLADAKTLDEAINFVQTRLMGFTIVRGQRLRRAFEAGAGLLCCRRFLSQDEQTRAPLYFDWISKTFEISRPWANCLSQLFVFYQDHHKLMDCVGVSVRLMVSHSSRILNLCQNDPKWREMWSNPANK